MRLMFLFVFFILEVSNANTPIWSKTGHRVIGEVAEKHLTKKASKAIHTILKGQNIVAVSNYADFIKADGAYKKYSPWHYVNFPADKKYSEVTPSSQGDLVIGIEKCINVLEDQKSSESERVFYLKMLIHLVGDLHQPMHVGRLSDKGGNDIQLKWFGRGTNLHRVWDANMIDDYGMSYSELAQNLPRLTKLELSVLQSGNVLEWVEESQDIANELYESVEIGQKLGYSYNYKYWKVVENQLLKGGVRLAKILNEIYK